MDPPIERIQDPGCGALHFQGLGQVAKSIEKTAHCGLGRDVAPLCTANSIGDCRHHLLPRLGQLVAENGASEVLVAFARSNF